MFAEPGGFRCSRSLGRCRRRRLTIWNFLIFLVLYFMLFDKLRAYPGMTFLAYVFLYSIGRFLIEPLRTDSIMLFGLPAPSVVSGVLIVVSALAMAVQYALTKKNRNLNS